MSSLIRLEIAVAISAVLLGWNANRNREASAQEFQSCWHPWEAADMKVNPVTLEPGSARAREYPIAPAVDACMAEKSLFITAASPLSCPESRLPGCYFRPWLEAAFK